MRFYKIIINGVEYKIGLKKIGEGVYKVKIGERETEVFVEDVFEKNEKEDLKGGTKVFSEISGVVVKILVKVGDFVKAGETIAVVEAMKMEHEVKSPKNGVILELKVREGQNIVVGDTIAVIL
ncbi:MAG: DUF2118 domain-containing protein [Archaeoglobales archaeon]|nr:DUF2118 domain-containing protein [Archaeoglobales archaeon]